MTKPKPRDMNWRGGLRPDQRRAYLTQKETERDARMKRLLAQILKRAKSVEFGRLEALMELEEARLMALNTYPPQATAAVNATVAKCRVMPYVHAPSPQPTPCSRCGI